MTGVWDERSVQSPAHLDVVIRTGHLGVVFHIEAVLETEGNEETLLQLDTVQAVRALGVGAGEVGAGDHPAPLGVQVVAALH